MATFGARYSRWAPFAPTQADENKNAIPKYGAVKTLGELNKLVDEITTIEGGLDGDDRKPIQAYAFSKGKVSVDSVFVALKTAAEVLGADVDEANGLAFSGEDQAPYGGYGCITHHQSPNKVYWQALFYPMVKAMVPAGETYTSRGDTLTFATDKLVFGVAEPLCGKYKIVKDFDTEKEANDYIDSLFSGTGKVPGLTGAAAAADVQAQESASPSKGK